MKQSGKRIVLGVTGSIAAYKAAELVRMMTANTWEVRVVMTESAHHFVGELTFRTLSRNAVHCRMFEEPGEWQPEHISLAEWADVFVVAPCTANVIARMAGGMADDLLACTFLATRAPVIVAPAMNEKMWTNAATAANVEILRSRGVTVMETGSGDLACGYRGKGRLAALELIIDEIASRMKETKQ